MSLRAKFDAWRKERLDRKLLAIRLRYEDDAQYVPKIVTPRSDPNGWWKKTDKERERILLQDSSLFVDGTRAIISDPKGEEVEGRLELKPDMDPKEYNKMLLEVYGPVEERIGVNNMTPDWEMVPYRLPSDSLLSDK